MHRLRSTHKWTIRSRLTHRTTSQVRPRRGVPISWPGSDPRHRTRMSRAKHSAMTGTAELNAMIERVAPDVLGLLADGVPRTKGAVVAALAGRHEGEEVALTLVRLTVTGRVEETGGEYALGMAEP